MPQRDPSLTQRRPIWATGKGERRSGLIPHAGLVEWAFNRMIRKSKANALWLRLRVWTGFEPFSRQNRPDKPNGRWYKTDDFAWESTLKKVVPLR